jgi:hypothetical protein
MLKSLLRTARVSSTLRNALQGAEVREAGGVRQFTCVGHDVKASSMMNGYAPRNASNHENCIEGATLPSSPMMLLGFHSLLPATALAVAELSRNAGPIQLPSSIELVYGENLKNGENALHGCFALQRIDSVAETCASFYQLMMLLQAPQASYLRLALLLIGNATLNERFNLVCSSEKGGMDSWPVFLPEEVAE